MEATYTLPLATMGGLPFAKFRGSSPAAVIDERNLRFSPSYALRLPGTVIWLASPILGNVAHRMPVPGREPFDEMLIMPPGMPLGARMEPIAAAGIVNL